MAPLRPLYGLTLNGLAELAEASGMPRFAARQMARWLYVRGAASIDAMTDLSARNRALLSAEYEIGLRAPEGLPPRATARRNTSTAPPRAPSSSRPTSPTESGPRSASPRRPAAAWAAASAPRAARGCNTRSRPATSSTRSPRSPSANGSPTWCSWGWASRWTTSTTCWTRWRFSPRSGATAGRPPASPSPRPE